MTTRVEEVRVAPPPPVAPPRPKAKSDTSDGPPLLPNRGFVARVAAMFSSEGRKYDGPVSWLLGRQMVGSMKGLLLYSAYGKKLDPRDWMTARAFSFDPDEKTKTRPPFSYDPEDKTRPPKPVFFDPPEGLKIETLRETQKNKGGFWFDYISDTGDGMRATYSLAYLTLCNLTMEGVSDPREARAGTLVEMVKEGGARPLLPRGEFLFIGGDTAYHASDYMTLINRIYTTFQWAYEDAAHDDMILESAPPRPLYGIPGNHDYYDQLDGFRRQFRHPPKWEPGAHDGLSKQPLKAHDTEDTAQLILPGYYRTQEASYLALRLPYDWVLWGLDTEVGQIDERQKDFFHQFCHFETRTAEQEVKFRKEDGTEVVVVRKGQQYRVVAPPDRLIVATCSPTTYFGKIADPEDYKSADAFGQLGIEQPFLPKGEQTDDGQIKAWKRGDPVPDLDETTGDKRLRKGQCRLDISGDVHHYARYWGPAPPAGSVPTRVAHGHQPNAKAPSSDSYASIVSGIGGAFHHPSETYVDEVREQSLYPSEETSTDVVSRSIFKFWNIWTGGAVWLAGGVVAFIIYFAFAVAPSSRQFLHNLPHFGLGLASAEQVRRMVVPLSTEKARAEANQGLTQDEVEARRKAAEEHRTAVEARNKQTQAAWQDGPGWKLWLGLAPPTPCDPDAPSFYFGPCRDRTPSLFWLQILIGVLASVPLFIGAFVKSIYEKEKKGARPAAAVDETKSEGSPGTDAKASNLVMTPEGLKIKPARVDLEHFGEPGRALLGLCLLAVAMFIIGPVMVEKHSPHITPFNNSLMVLATVIWAVAAFALVLRYSEFLFNKSQHRDKQISKKDWIVPWVLSAAAVAAVGFGLWAYGQNNAAALIITDSLFVLVVIGLGVGLVWGLPFYTGAELLSRKPKAVRVVGKLLIGLWHFILQIAVPLILVRKGSVLLWVLVAVAIAFATAAGGWLLRKGSGLGLVLVWFLLGAFTLALPFVLPRFVPGHWGIAQQWFAGPNATGWYGLWATVVAAVVGAVMCCVWFGWYLGVCFAYNGHNNEVGGAARIEQFKQLIRFHLDPKGGLTGYVIAVNDPAEKGKDLVPHLVDVFHLEPKKADY